MRIIIHIPKINGNKNQRRKWLIKTFGSGVVDSGYVLFIEHEKKNNERTNP